MLERELKLFVDFDDVVISTRPRLEKQLFKAYKYASSTYWEKEKKKVKEDYQKKLDKLREREIKIKSLKKDTSRLLNELYEQEMNFYTEYIRKLEDIEEDELYIGVNIDYALEILNNGSNYIDGDNPENPYYIDYNKILNMKYVIPESLQFVKQIIEFSNIKTSILSHKNCNRESLRKQRIIRKNIGNIPLHTLDFHTDSFSTKKRQISSKAEYVMNLYGINQLDKDFILIDDSKTNIIDWINHGGTGILYSKNQVKGINNIEELTYDNFTNCISEEQKKLIKR